MQSRLVLLLLSIGSLLGISHGDKASCRADESHSGPVAALAKLDTPGGLVVQLGAGDLELVKALAHSGRFVVQVLDDDADRVAQARDVLDEQGLCGWVTVERPAGAGTLPYTENLVNLVAVQSPVGESTWREIVRVLRPLGIVMVSSVGGAVTASDLKGIGLHVVEDHALGEGVIVARKPWPETMDEWTHPRHSASGNAVSADVIVGPPRRVRWLAGPWEEVANLVTIRGRNFYGGMLARDGFNGLRLWHRDVAPTPSNGTFTFRALRGSAPPVAGGDRVFVFTAGKLQAIDCATGETVQEYPQPDSPQQILFDQGILVTVDGAHVRCLDAESGRALWSHGASQPRHVVAGDGLVALIQGNPRRGETCEVVVLDQRSGQVRWRRSDLPWAARATRCVYYGGMLTFEVSTLNNDGPDNSIHIVSAQDGQLIRDITYLPGMNHRRQARAMFVGDQLWLLEGGRGADDQRAPIEAVAIDVATGNEQARYEAGLAHCFPPVATPRFLFSGEMNLTDLETGQVDANRITKAACGTNAGWFPAHGLIYVTPKHCVCWPMLRGYVALAPARHGGNPATRPVSELDFRLEQQGEAPEVPETASENDWPMYRHDAWRSASTKGGGPVQLDTVWRVDLSKSKIPGPIDQDWQEDPYIKGPVSAPVVAGNTVFVARPHAHQVVALDASNGQQRWQFTANGRVDTPPTIHRGLCLFGTTSGWVYCLRADDGTIVWRLRAAPLDERIVAYGQVESPWPVPGSVLVVDDVAYFAAGRQSFADGGILVFAVDPVTGAQRWVQRLDSVPQQGFYRSSGLEFDNFDLLHREGDGVAMSRWVFDRQSGSISADVWRAFARLNTGNGAAMVPQGSWSYAPRNQSRTETYSPQRPLVTFRDRTLFGCTEDKQAVYRRDFRLEEGEEFDTKWITGWENSNASRNDGVAWRSQRLAEKAAWTRKVIEGESSATIDALSLAGERLYLADSSGRLAVVRAEDGRVVAEKSIPQPLWDGMAVACGRLFVTSSDGQLLCIGAP